nr:unnamed protein product [Digitaria exilis]
MLTSSTWHSPSSCWHPTQGSQGWGDTMENGRKGGSYGPGPDQHGSGRLGGGYKRQWTPCVQKTIERYRTYAKDNVSNKTVHQDIEQVKADAEGLAKKLEALEAYKRSLFSYQSTVFLAFGKKLSFVCDLTWQTQLLEEQVNKLREKEMTLRKNNEDLREKCKNQPPLVVTPARGVITVEDHHPGQKDDAMDVETELYIGLPGRDQRPKKAAGVMSG